MLGKTAHGATVMLELDARVRTIMVDVATPVPTIDRVISKGQLNGPVEMPLVMSVWGLGQLGSTHAIDLI